MGKRILGWSCLAIALGCSSVGVVPAQARAVVDVSVGLAPPPLRVERVGVRAGHVWAPGYWRWNGARHVWVGGYWVAGRPGYRYVGANWVHVNGRWHMRRGHWVRP